MRSNSPTPTGSEEHGNFMRGLMFGCLFSIPLYAILAFFIWGIYVIVT